MGIVTVLPTSNQAVAVPTATDWVAVSKIVVLEIGFLSTLGALITGHANADITSLAWALGATLGLLRMADIAANIANVRAFLGKSPVTGVVPQAAGTPLFTTPVSSATATTNNEGGVPHAGS